MTTKFTISLPDDLAEYVRSQGNASGYIAEAVQRQRTIDATRAALAAVGVEEVPREEYERIAADVAEINKRRKDPKRRAQLDAKLAEFRRPAK
ncbi:MAG TPA: hypothetical protein VFC19_28040 [Candidatus Limnocylindrales bacterium]|nr:hypothetical protein [Candidatus Limnocylindrales bacterium]